MKKKEWKETHRFSLPALKKSNSSWQQTHNQNKNIFDGRQELLPGIINENGENCSRSICSVHLALLQKHHHKKMMVHAKFSQHNISCPVDICRKIKQTFNVLSISAFHTISSAHQENSYLFLLCKCLR